MLKITSPKEMAKLDAFYSSEVGIDEQILMENASFGVVNAISNIKKVNLCTAKILIVCGVGNNGGDGLCVQRLLKMRGTDSIAIIIGSKSSLSRSVDRNLSINRKLGLDVTVIDDAEALCTFFEKNSFELIIDAIFGTGLNRIVDGIYKTAVELINKQSAYRLAIDIASGIDGDTGRTLGCCVNADETVAIQFIKRGHLLFPGREYTGKLDVAPICPQSGIADSDFAERMLEHGDIAKLLPQRKQNSNKGSYGKVLIIAGAKGMGGAALMCARSAYAVGCGLVKVICHRDTVQYFSTLPEAMISAFDELNEALDAVKQGIEWANTVAIGPGLGTECSAIAKLLQAVLSSRKTAVIDADALNALSVNRELLSLLHPNAILTPHPAEMSRICGCNTAQILNSPLYNAQSFSAINRCTLLLKGATSIIASHDGGITYNTSGNSGLSKGGSGDTLTGIIASLAAQGLNPYDSASLGAYLLGLSCESATKALGERLVSNSMLEHFLNKQE